jgi:hypothetical protein
MCPVPEVTDSCSTVSHSLNSCQVTYTGVNIFMKMMKAASFSEKSEHCYQTTQCHIHERTLHASIRLGSSCFHKHCPALDILILLQHLL